MARSMTMEEMVAVLEAASPNLVDAIRNARKEQKGVLHFSESEKAAYPEELIDLAKEACPVWSSEGFNAKKWYRAALPAVRKLREAHPETSLAFLLRKGVQTLANDWYTVTPREWQDYCQAASSNAVAEWYPPLYGSELAIRIERGTRFPEGRIIGEDSVMVNYKFGLVESFDRELFDDDQTGQIRLRAQRLGQSMALTENAYAAIRFIGTAGSFGALSVPATKYSTTRTDGSVITTPFDTTLHAQGAGSYGNRPGTFGQLSLTLLKQAWSELLKAKDPLGNIIIVNPNTLLLSTQDALHGPLLVKPPAGVPYYPAPIGASGTTASTATAGFPGGAFGANPFMGLGINPVVSRFFAAWAWSLGEKGKGIVFQERDPLEVIQENPAAGAAFEFDAYRFRSRRRFEVDWIGGGSRFWWLGNDGTAATQTF